MPIYIWFPGLAGLATGFAFMNIPPVADQFMAMLGTGHAGLSLVLSSVIWTHALFQIPAGLIADRHPPRLVALAGAVLAVLCNCVPFLAPASFALAVGCRLAMGFSTALTYLAVLKIITLLTPPDQQAKAQGIYGGMVGFGNMSPYLLLPLFGGDGWIWAYAILAALFALTGLSLLWVPKVSVKPSARSGRLELLPIGSVLRTVLPSRTMIAIGVVHGLCYGTLNNTGQWLPSILADRTGTTIASWAMATMLVLFVGSASRLSSGYMLRYISTAGLVLLGLALTGVGYLLLSVAPGSALTLACGLLLALVASVNYGAVFNITTNVFGPQYTGVCLGYQATVANLVFVGLTLLYGMVREHTGSFTLAQIAAGIFCFAVFALSRRRIRAVKVETSDKP